MPPVDTHPTHRYFLWLGFLLVLVVAALVAGWLFPEFLRPSSSAFPANAPAPTETDYVAVQKGFQYLVSYTDQGFVPASLTVNKGETVRFTNAAASTFTLSLSGASDSSLSHLQYFEYTFAKTGTYIYSDGTNSGTVTVQ